jgi:hypothetical protein
MRPLMTMSAVGVVMSLAYAAVVNDPRLVGAYRGLTPRVGGTNGCDGFRR